MRALLAAVLTTLVVAAADASDFKLSLPLGLQEQASWIPDDND